MDKIDAAKVAKAMPHLKPPKTRVVHFKESNYADVMSSKGFDIKDASMVSWMDPEKLQLSSRFQIMKKGNFKLPSLQSIDRTIMPDVSTLNKTSYAESWNNQSDSQFTTP